MLASGPKLIELAGEVADGVMMLVGLPSWEFRSPRRAPTCTPATRRAGRDPAGLARDPDRSTPRVGDPEWATREWPRREFRAGQPWLRLPERVEPPLAGTSRHRAAPTTCAHRTSPAPTPSASAMCSASSAPRSSAPSACCVRARRWDSSTRSCSPCTRGRRGTNPRGRDRRLRPGHRAAAGLREAPSAGSDCQSRRQVRARPPAGSPVFGELTLRGEARRRRCRSRA